MFSILHISDLHRSPSDNITNAELISALVSDRHRYVRETPAIKPPDIIVVSGDIIQGVPLNALNSGEELSKQYAIALEFLSALADRFVDGDRSRVVIVPGNHDIDWVSARSAMSLVPEDQIPPKLSTELSRVDTLYRWDWQTRQLLLISDEVQYESRMGAYWAFFDAFYGPSKDASKASTPKTANIYSFCGGRIGLAAFNSCQGNDCFAFHGSIPRAAVAQAHLDMIDSGGFELFIAVWHHNVEGPPHRTDYMDLDIVRGMIGRGFRLGLYGHQHRPDASPVQIHLADKETMAVVSAGSLCAGASELPTGALRGYNIIEINDDMLRARVHVREMSVANLFCAGRRLALGGKSWADLFWDAPADLAGRMPDFAQARIAAIVTAAESELKSGAPNRVKEILLPVISQLPAFGRLLLLEAARRIDDKPLLAEILMPPQSVSELIELIELCIIKKDFDNADDHLGKFGAQLGTAEAHLKELRGRIAIAKAITK
jgi:predicted phosphodiesterase